MLTLKKYSSGYKIRLFVSVFLIIADIVFLITDWQDRTFSFVTFSTIIVGSLLIVSESVKNFFYTIIVGVLFLSIGVATHLYIGLPTLSDVVNGVNFIGGNPIMVIIFGSIFLLGTIVVIITSFMQDLYKKN